MVIISNRIHNLNLPLGGKINEDYVDTRVTSYDRLKIKTTQSILPDPESIIQHIKRANLQCYQYKHCTENWLTLIDPCSSGWTREENGELVPLWFNGKQFPNELEKRTEKQLNSEKASSTPQLERPPRADTRPKRFSALVARYALQDSVDITDSEDESSESDSTSESNSSISGSSGEDDPLYM